MAQALTRVYSVKRLQAVPSPTREREPGQRSYTRAEIIAKLLEWAAIHGAMPTTADWEPSRARRAGREWQAERFLAGDWPSMSVVRREFKTLTGAARASGLTPRRAPKVRRRFRSSNEILGAIREWVHRYGEPPTMADWEPSRARRAGQAWRIERYHRGDWPSTRSVRNHFGTLSAAVEAAGLDPRPQGLRQVSADDWRLRNRELAEARRTWDFTGFGPASLSAKTRDVARAAHARNIAGLRDSLIDLAASALAWADQLSPEQEADQVAA